MLKGEEEVNQCALCFSSCASELTVISQFYTSLGRVVELPPTDDSELDMETRAEDEGELISIKPDSGKVVGFFARAVSSTAALRGEKLI